MANCARCGRNLPAFSFGKKICQWCVQHEAAQRGEEPEDAKQIVMPVPWSGGVTSSIGLTQVLFGINVAVFVGMLLAGVNISGGNNQELVRWGANWGPLTTSGQWWRLITYNFVHIGLLHIGLNMWCLWDFGSFCESLYGPWTYGAIYLLSGVSGGLACLIFTPGAVTAGASGAIFGLVGALIASLYLGEFSMPRALIQARLRSVAIFAAYSLIFGFVAGGISNAAHLGGLAAGLVMGAVVAVAAPARGDIVRRVAVLGAVASVLAGGVLWVRHSQSYAQDAQDGMTLLLEGKTDQAIAELERAVRARPDFAPARYSLAHAYAIKGNLAKAQAELENILQRQPQDPDALYSLGYILVDQKKLPQAKATFTRLLAAQPENAEAHFGLAFALAAGDEHQAAIAEYQAAQRADPGLERVYYNLGLSYSKLKQYNDAIAALLKSREKDGDSEDVEIALAAAYEGKGLKQQAEEARRKAETLKTKVDK